MPCKIPHLISRRSRSGSAKPDRRLEQPRDVGPTFQVGLDDYLLEVREVARYRVRKGREIVIEPFPGSSERRIKVFLLGTVFGALCHQRGLLPLHASAIALGDRCIAFAGPSGAGKSTLATFLGDRGYPIVSDDICVVGLDGQGLPVAWSGLSRLKLWRDAVEALGRDPRDFDAIFEGVEKYQLSPERPMPRRPLKLARLYVLSEARLPQQEGISRLARSLAFDAIIGSTYRPRLLAPMGQARAHFALCAAIVKHASIHAVYRRWGFDSFSAEVEKLERHFIAGAA